MSIIAAQPKRILHQNTTITKLAKECETQLKGNQHMYLNDK